MIKRIIAAIFPVSMFTVRGSSMEPTLHMHQKILVKKQWVGISLHTNDIVVLRSPSTHTPLVKRIKEIKKNTYYVEGDNREESTDSRDFGWVNKENMIGKVIHIFS